MRTSPSGRLAKGAFWSLLSAASTQGLGLATSMLIARMIGTEEFGCYGIILNTIGMFGVLAGMGLGMTATKYIAELRVIQPDRAARIVAFSTAFSLLTAGLAASALLAMAPFLTESVLARPQLVPELRIAAAVLFFNSISGAQTGVLSGFEAFRQIALVSFVRTAVMLPISLGSAMIWGLRGAVIALAVSGLLSYILNEFAIRQACQHHNIVVPRLGFHSETPILWNFALPTVLGGAISQPAMWATLAVLANQPNGYTQVGLFTAANQWRTVVVFLPVQLVQPLLSVLSNLLAVQDLISFRRVLNRGLVLSIAFGTGIAVPILFFSSNILASYGHDFLLGRNTLVLLSFAGIFFSTSMVIGQGIISMEKVWWVFGLNTSWSLILVLLASWLIVPHGAVGLAIAYLAASLFSAVAGIVCCYIFLRKRSVLSRASESNLVVSQSCE